MFSCELKFTIDICKKWIDEKFSMRYLELGPSTKQRFKREKPIGAKRSVQFAILTIPHSENMTYFDFVVKKEHSFIRNVFDSD